MRKIETLMNAAITNGRDFRLANTEVVSVSNTDNRTSTVLLHGHKIAEVVIFTASARKEIRLFDGGHRTPTTKSRLNAVLRTHGEAGDNVFQKNFKWFVTLNTVQGLSTVPFFSSMKV